MGSWTRPPFANYTPLVYLSLVSNIGFHFSIPIKKEKKSVKSTIFRFSLFLDIKLKNYSITLKNFLSTRSQVKLFFHPNDNVSV